MAANLLENGDKTTTSNGNANGSGGANGVAKKPPITFQEFLDLQMLAKEVDKKFSQEAFNAAISQIAPVTKARFNFTFSLTSEGYKVSSMQDRAFTAQSQTLTRKISDEIAARLKVILHEQIKKRHGQEGLNFYIEIMQTIENLSDDTSTYEMHLSKCAAHLALVFGLPAEECLTKMLELHNKDGASNTTDSKQKQDNTKDEPKVIQSLEDRLFGPNSVHGEARFRIYEHYSKELINRIERHKDLLKLVGSYQSLLDLAKNNVGKMIELGNDLIAKDPRLKDIAANLFLQEGAEVAILSMMTKIHESIDGFLPLAAEAQTSPEALQGVVMGRILLSVLQSLHPQPEVAQGSAQPQPSPMLNAFGIANGAGTQPTAATATNQRVTVASVPAPKVETAKRESKTPAKRADQGPPAKKGGPNTQAGR